jgi:PAS domain S-box-containing protein
VLGFGSAGWSRTVRIQVSTGFRGVPPFIGHSSEEGNEDGTGNQSGLECCTTTEELCSLRCGTSPQDFDMKRRAQEPLFSGTRFPSDILKTMRLIAVILDCDAILRYANEYLLELTGWQLEEVLNKSWFEVFIPKQDAEVTDVFKDVLNERTDAWHHENPILTKSGALRYIRWNNTVIRDKPGTVIGTASIGEDVTERRELERSILEAASVEQQRLSLEIHDGLGQDLFAVSLLAQSIASSAERDAPTIASELSRLARITSGMIETCRDIANGLSPLGRIQGGLVEALRLITTMPFDWRGPVVHYEVNDNAPLRVPLESLDQIYRIAQEGLTNAIKHSHAKIIKVRLQITPTRVRLEIRDDGVGPQTNSSSRVGIGLAAMEYRANLIHATLSRRKALPSGTLIVCEVSQPQEPVMELGNRA